MTATTPAPEQIGPYMTVEVLGRGSMGVVYRARHRDTGAMVALKSLQLLRQDSLSGLRREIHALSRIRHPGIVRIVDQGMEQGVPWYAMELLEGSTLLQYRASFGGDASAALARDSNPRSAEAPSRLEPIQPSTLASVLTVVRRLCRPLAYLHGEGIVHRDLKPQNVLVRPDGMPVVMDFGLTFRFAGVLSRDALDVEAVVGGTALYMAPEQIRGEAVDARADLYSLGCILYELLTGQPPFVDTSISKILRQHLETAPRAPSELQEGLPTSLDSLVLRLLAKPPRERVGYASDVELALEALGAEPELGSERSRTYLYRPGFAGRRSELGILSQHLHKLFGRSGGVVLVGGESGVGKTRLALEAAKEARNRGARALAGECRAASVPGEGAETGSGPLEPLRPVLLAIADYCREHGLVETQRILAQRGKVLSAYESALDDLPGQAVHPEPSALPADLARLRLFDDLASTLQAFAKSKALFIVLDDLQWADTLTLGFLEFLLRSRRLEESKLLVLGTYRTEEARGPLQALLGLPEERHLKLGRMSERAVGSMVCDMLALETPPVAFVRFLSRHSEGNPFYVGEYLRTAVRERLLWRDAQGRWQVDLPGRESVDDTVYEALPLPESVRELVSRRLDALPDAARRLVEVAAVLGREMDSSHLGAIARRLGIDVLEGSAELLAQQILEEPSAGRLRFAHDKIREVAYAGIPGSRCMELHRGAAEVMEEAVTNLKDYGALAQHWELGGAPDRAQPHHLAAARHGRDGFAWHEAEAHYRAYLRRAPENSIETFQARYELGEKVLRASGQSHQGIEMQILALEQARRLELPQLEGEVLRSLGGLYIITGQGAQARAALEQALDIGRRIGNRDGAGIALATLAIFHHQQGRSEAALSLYLQALEVHRWVGDRRAEGIALNNLANLHRDQGRPEQAGLLYAESVEILRAAGDRRGEGIALGNLALLHHEQGRIEDARPLYEQALVIHRSVGHRRFEGIVLGHLAGLHKDQGRLEDARPLYESALAIYRQVGDLRLEGTGLGYLASLHYEQGRYDEARPLFEQALAFLRQVKDPRDESIVLVDFALLHQERGQIEEARTLHEQALAIQRQVGDHEREATALFSMASLERRAFGRIDAAHQMTLEADALVRRTGAKISLALCLCEQGHIALAEGTSGRLATEEAQSLAASLAALAESRVGKALSRLERAQRLFESGKASSLFHGELFEDLPAGLRRWIIERGNPETRPGVQRTEA